MRELVEETATDAPGSALFPTRDHGSRSPCSSACARREKAADQESEPLKSESQLGGQLDNDAAVARLFTFRPSTADRESCRKKVMSDLHQSRRADSHLLK
jgi:hypothetical protein